jgi:hypothetical protein
MMTKEQKIIRAKVGLLGLAKQLGNVSQACKMLGYSRNSFFRFKEPYDKGGDLALAEMSRRKPILANRTPLEIEAQIIALSLEQPDGLPTRQPCHPARSARKAGSRRPHRRWRLRPRKAAGVDFGRGDARSPRSIVPLPIDGPLRR